MGELAGRVPQRSCGQEKSRGRPCEVCRGRLFHDMILGARNQAPYQHDRSSGSRGVGPVIAPRGCRSAFSGSLPMTGSRHERQPPMHTATGIAPDSHRIPSAPPLPGRQTRGHHAFWNFIIGRPSPDVKAAPRRCVWGDLMSREEKKDRLFCGAAPWAVMATSAPPGPAGFDP